MGNEKLKSLFGLMLIIAAILLLSTGVMQIAGHHSIVGFAIVGVIFFVGALIPFRIVHRAGSELEVLGEAGIQILLSVAFGLFIVLDIVGIGYLLSIGWAMGQ